MAQAKASAIIMKSSTHLLAQTGEMSLDMVGPGEQLIDQINRNKAICTFKSIFIISAPHPSDSTMSTTVSTEVYYKEQRVASTPSFTEAFGGEERSVINLCLPGWHGFRIRLMCMPTVEGSKGSISCLCSCSSCRQFETSWGLFRTERRFDWLNWVST